MAAVSPGGVTRIRAAARRPVVWVAVLAVAWLALAAPGAAQEGLQFHDTDLTPGEFLVSLDEDGEIWAISTDGGERLLAEGLDHPRGVAVADDGTILVAEAGSDRVIAAGGPHEEAVELISYPRPEAVVASPDGFVVSSFSEGTVSVVDMETMTVTDLATDLVNPAAVLIRPDGIFVAEAGAQRVVRLDDDGPTPVVGGFELPVGLADGIDDALYVTDVVTGQVVATDGPHREVVAELARPSHVVAVGPASAADEPVTLFVATADGLVELDPATGETRLLGPDGPLTYSAAVVPVETPPRPMEVPEPPEPDDQADPAGAQGAGEDLAAPAPPEVSEQGWSWVVGLLAVAGVIAVCVVGVFWVHLRRAGASGEDLLESHTYQGPNQPQVGNLDEAFGPCLPLEVEFEQAEVLLARACNATEAARDRLRRLQAHDANPVGQAELHLATDAGRRALGDYRAGRIGARELAAQWREAGESGAIEQVRRAGRSDVVGEGPGGTVTAGQVQAAIAEVSADIERLREREARCAEELETARLRLAECRGAVSGAL